MAEQSSPKQEGGGADLASPGENKKKKRSRRAILTPGQVLGNNYEVVEQIGEGGMAVVYKARQKSLNRFVAIKALHPKLAKDPEFVTRFEAESGALAALSHPNVISILERGNEQSVFYFIMEYIDGQDLDQKIIANSLTPNDWRQVVAACTDALEYVHKRGIIHRDIKPSNILVDSEGRVKLGDFGIAHIISGDGEDQEAKDRMKAMGTAHYMAPEQKDAPATVDARADIYALGVAYYKMMTRMLPIGEYPAPSEANPQVPVAVDKVLARAMMHDREDRFASVREFSDELQRALKDQTMSITSALNYRGRSGSSLYSGADFATPTGGSGSSTENRKPDSSSRAFKKDRKSDTGSGSGSGFFRRDRKSGTGTQTGTGTGASDSKVLKHSKNGAGRVRASSDLTPLPVDKGSSATATAAPSAKKGTNLLLIMVVLLLVLAGGAILAFAFLGDGGNGQPVQAANPAQPVAPITETRRGSASQREEIRRRQLEERQRALLGENAAGESAPLDTATATATAPPAGEQQSPNAAGTNQQATTAGGTADGSAP